MSNPISQITIAKVKIAKQNQYYQYQIVENSVRVVGIPIGNSKLCVLLVVVVVCVGGGVDVPLFHTSQVKGIFQSLFIQKARVC